jgi:hypothetical protein
MFAQAARQRVPLRLLLCLLLVSVSGLLLFIRGFLLTRVEIAEVSQCAPVGSSSPAAHGAVDGCWVPRRFDTAVFVIIDAMRFDFAAPDAPVDAHTKAFRGHLPVIGNNISGTGHPDPNSPLVEHTFLGARASVP